MLRRPLAASAVSYAAGIAFQHIADSIFSLIVMMAASVLACLLFYLPYIWNKKEIITEKVSKSDVNISTYAKGRFDRYDEVHREFLKKREKYAVAAAAVMFISGVTAGHISCNRISQFNDIYGEEILIEGIIKSVEIKGEDRITVKLQICAAGTANGGTFHAAAASDAGAEGGMPASYEADGRPAVYEGGRYPAADGDENYADLRKVKKENILVTVSRTDAMAAPAATGCRALVRGCPERPAGAANPSSFDYRMYLRSQKVLSVMKVDEAAFRIIEERPRGIYMLLNLAAVFKNDYERRLIQLLGPEYAGVLCGILFGDDSLMEDDIKESFQKTGTAHLLAASGLHTGFIYGLFSVIFRKPKTLKGNLPVIAMLVVYAALAGFSASVVRAVFMITVSIIGKTTHRRYDFLTCIAFCMLVMLIYEPAYLFSSGFQLSFSAVFTLSIVLKAAEKAVKKLSASAPEKYRPAVKAVLMPAAAMASLQLGMTPLMIEHFHYISPGGLIINTPAIAAAGIIVPAGIIMIPAVYLAGIIPFPAAFAAAMEEMLIRLLMFLNDMITGSVFDFRYTASPPAAALFFYYFILIFVCGESGPGIVKERYELFYKDSAPASGISSEAVQPEAESEQSAHGGGHSVCRAGSAKAGCIKAAAPIIAAAAVLAGSAGVCADIEYLVSDLIFVDVGQGDCAHLKASGGTDIIFDSGGSRMRDIGSDVLAPYFLGCGVKDIDIAVISHLHSDHYQGLLTLKDAVHIKKLMLSSYYRDQAAEISEETGVPQEDIIFAEAGTVVEAGGVIITALTPLPESVYKPAVTAEEDENVCCLVVKAEYKSCSALFTGDIDAAYEEVIADYYGSDVQTDILKVSHHGSRYSSSPVFLEEIKPLISVIQVGKNNYGHPSTDVLEKLGNNGSAVFRNDISGAVMLDLGENIRVHTMK